MLGYLKHIPFRLAVKSMAINTAKGLGISRRQRACLTHLSKSVEFAEHIATGSYEIVRQCLPNLTGLTGLEIGPGDNLGVAECFLANGAVHMICVEQFATVKDSPELRELIAARYGPYTGTPELISDAFENVSRQVDFIYSIDVLEHVADVPAAIRHMANLLKPGGIAVHSVDFAGHNAYLETGIDFLTCPDWMWNLFHSHLETTNRIRYDDLRNAIKDAGLELVSAVPTISVDDARVELLRKDMLPRYRNRATEDLKVLQATIAFRKPA